MKADPRVQFAPDVQLTDEEVARAIISLADALARGDAGAVSGLVSKSARPTIEAINDLGGFTSDVEAVRVVFVGKTSEIEGFKPPMEAVEQLFSGDQAAIDQINKNLTPDVVERLGVLASVLAFSGGEFDVTLITPPMDADKLAKLREKWETLKSDPVKAATLEQIAGALTGNAPIPGLKNAEYIALLAVQTPSGVDLTGWGLEKAFGKWTFNNASTDGSVRQSASEWDGVGMAGFSANSTTGLAIAAKPATDESAEEPATPETPDDGSTPPEDEGSKPPTQKRTPRGPVQIPGG
jgi:hypothetical protein